MANNYNFDRNNIEACLFVYNQDSWGIIYPRAEAETKN